MNVLDVEKSTPYKWLKFPNTRQINATMTSVKTSFSSASVPKRENWLLPGQPRGKGNPSVPPLRNKKERDKNDFKGWSIKHPLGNYERLFSKTGLFNNVFVLSTTVVLRHFSFICFGWLNFFCSSRNWIRKFPIDIPHIIGLCSGEKFTFKITFLKNELLVPFFFFKYVFER